MSPSLAKSDIGNNGYSLIEMLMALAIFGVFLTVFYSFYDNQADVKTAIQSSSKTEMFLTDITRSIEKHLSKAIPFEMDTRPIPTPILSRLYPDFYNASPHKGNFFAQKTSIACDNGSLNPGAVCRAVDIPRSNAIPDGNDYSNGISHVYLSTRCDTTDVSDFIKSRGNFNFRQDCNVTCGGDRGRMVIRVIGDGKNLTFPIVPKNQAMRDSIGADAIAAGFCIERRNDPGVGRYFLVKVRAWFLGTRDGNDSNVVNKKLQSRAKVIRVSDTFSNSRIIPEN